MLQFQLISLEYRAYTTLEPPTDGACNDNSIHRVEDSSSGNTYKCTPGGALLIAAIRTCRFPGSSQTFGCVAPIQMLSLRGRPSALIEAKETELRSAFGHGTILFLYANLGLAGVRVHYFRAPNSTSRFTASGRAILGLFKKFTFTIWLFSKSYRQVLT
ncbi:hypothetical protein BJX99DRAFT_49216 [Aspergillus californicus]